MNNRQGLITTFNFLLEKGDQNFLLTLRSARQNRECLLHFFDYFASVTDEQSAAPFSEKMLNILQYSNGEHQNNLVQEKMIALQKKIICFAIDILLDDKGQLVFELCQLLKWQALSQLQILDLISGYIKALNRQIFPLHFQSNSGIEKLLANINEHYGDWVLEILSERKLLKTDALQNIENFFPLTIVESKNQLTSQSYLYTLGNLAYSSTLFYTRKYVLNYIPYISRAEKEIEMGTLEELSEKIQSLS